MDNQQPEKKKRLLLWGICFVIIVGIFAARLVCALIRVDWSDTLTRVMGGIEMVATAVLVFTYMRWRRNPN